MLPESMNMIEQEAKGKIMKKEKRDGKTKKKMLCINLWHYFTKGRGLSNFYKKMFAFFAADSKPKKILFLIFHH